MLTNSNIEKYKLRSGADGDGQPTFAAEVAGPWPALVEGCSKKLKIGERSVTAVQSARVPAGSPVSVCAVGDMLWIDTVPWTILERQETPGAAVGSVLFFLT